MRTLLRPGMEPMAPALAGGFLPTAPPGNSRPVTFEYIGWNTSFWGIPWTQSPLASSLPLVSFIYLHLEGAQRWFYSETNGAMCLPLPSSCCEISPLGLKFFICEMRGLQTFTWPFSLDILRLHYTFWILSHIGIVLPQLLSALLYGIES